MHPFRPVDVYIPTNRPGFFYLIVSLRQMDVTYIGETRSLRRRLVQHSSGTSAGSKQNLFIYLFLKCMSRGGGMVRG